MSVPNNKLLIPRCQVWSLSELGLSFTKSYLTTHTENLNLYKRGVNKKSLSDIELEIKGHYNPRQESLAALGSRSSGLWVVEGKLRGTNICLLRTGFLNNQILKNSKGLEGVGVCWVPNMKQPPC